MDTGVRKRGVSRVLSRFSPGLSGVITEMEKCEEETALVGQGHKIKCGHAKLPHLNTPMEI